MPIVMVALPNMGGALCLTPLSLADAMPCSNAAKTHNPLTSTLRRLRLGEQRKKEEERTNDRMKIYMVCPIT